jgi:hypothetical protein
MFRESGSTRRTGKFFLVRLGIADDVTGDARNAGSPLLTRFAKITPAA